jgi:hypothetical protein
VPQVVLFVFAALIAFGAFSTILTVGKVRRPVTPGVAAAVTLVGALEIAALAYISSQL